MRNILYILSFAGIACIAPDRTASAQEKGKLGEYDEIVIKRKDGEKDTKVTIEIKDNEVWIDGKKMDEYKNGNVIIQHREIRPQDGNMPHAGLQFFGGEGEIIPNKALLGVITEKMEAAGATIKEVSKDSPADKAGLREGDVITRINEKQISEPQDLYESIGELKPGDKVTVTYLRDGKSAKATATLDERKDMEARTFRMPQGMDRDLFRFHMPEMRDAPGGGKRLGLSVQDTEDGKGARVLRVTPGSAAEKAGFKTDDVITAIAGKTVNNAKDVAETYSDNKEKESISASIKRNGSVQTLTIKVPKVLNTENL